ncbi:MAG: UDP-N-acetylmuramoyl-L-alanyl-D-glutamate--2,6-diaminopimelate ligase [Pontibacterium sp.]
MTTIIHTLSELIPELKGSRFAAIKVRGITQDSRDVKPGDLFCARAGGCFKGTDFVPDAIRKGAAAVLLDGPEVSDCAEASVPLIPVKNLARQMGEIASRFYGEPGKQLYMIGITGTNGKTSCSHFLAQALNRSGKRTAVIGTAGNGFPGSLQAATHTTPDAIGLQRLLSELLAQGAEAVVMEVSSHAVDQQRIAGMYFDIAAFTNLSRDHLDYHGTMSAYGETKARLFTEWQPGQSVICLDDAFGAELYERLKPDQAVIGYGEQQGDLQAVDIELHTGGVRATLQSPWGNIPLDAAVVGRFNLANLMLTAAVLGAMGYKTHEIASGLSALESVPGRMQCFGGVKQPLIIVDYAHTPDALLKALQAARAHTQGQLFCVFGCGGDRDTGKRPEMGDIAAFYADRVVVTSDNPRTEDPARIIEAIVLGITDDKNLKIEADRELAIRFAVAQASIGDVVLVAGKGHENYQEVNGQRLPFLDEQVVQTSLQAWSL